MGAIFSHIEALRIIMKTMRMSGVSVPFDSAKKERTHPVATDHAARCRSELPIQCNRGITSQVAVAIVHRRHGIAHHPFDVSMRMGGTEHGERRDIGRGPL